ncbi:BREX-1 system phosphatase PglZ type A [Ruminococcus sp.]|uniref:BREX-1 system phosphatase PglZ type A n=1 Tax=Ruminococcus sp. TaxID=41978 RepID=UPI002588DC3D|nr:BREX-1 system phosphatase PglZ type A [Ruminococcus sp.]MCR5021796.1 BREX-1 system phosphatase PglZ type A [Ruminococcus sp.]
MAELNLNQIADKLNEAFSGDARQLIFWYDENGEFAEDIDTLALDNAKVYKLEPNNQIYTKYFLTYEDTTANYLIYAPFPKPDVYDNHLEDMLLYSRQFFADRASLICAELGINEELKVIIQKYSSFFGAKDRTKRFYDFEIENWSEDAIKVGIMSAVCGTKTASFEEVVKVLLNNNLDSNPYMADFEKYGLIADFWNKAETYFGFTHQSPNLRNFTAALFLTYASKEITAEMPKNLKNGLTYKTGSVVAFLDNLMNNSEYAERFDWLSEFVYNGVGGDQFLSSFPVESIIECDAFKPVDEFIIKWMIERLEAEDTGAKLSGSTILQLCADRKRTHFGKCYAVQYAVIEYAYKIIYAGKYEPVSVLSDIVNNYTSKYYENDRNYRLFYFNYDKLEETSQFEKLRELIENIYTNDYLQNICANWTKAFTEETGASGLPLQIDFWNEKVAPIKERVVVFISDAMRYDVGVSLYEKLNADEKCKATLSAMQTILPSITMCGMAALLPHKDYELTADYKMLVDGKPCHSTPERAKIISNYNPKSLCIQYDELKVKKVDELKTLVSGLEVIYVYHNQIDARGDKAPTEDEVFIACDEAVEEIAYMIRRLTGTNVTRFLVTSDHGFIYKRDKLKVGNKIGDVSSKSDFMGKRFAVSNQAISMDGIYGVSLEAVYHNGDARNVSFPISADIFSSQGGGLNFVHGGCSPQEMIIPLIDVKTEKSKVETTFAEIAMTTTMSKITNLSVNLEFFQKQPVSDIVKPATYHIYFESEDGERVSNENQFHADSTESNPINTKAKLRFSFKNRIYSNKDKYYLVIKDEEHNIVLNRISFVIDIAMANDFGF